MPNAWLSVPFTFLGLLLCSIFEYSSKTFFNRYRRGGRVKRQFRQQEYFFRVIQLHMRSNPQYLVGLAKANEVLLWGSKKDAQELLECGFIKYDDQRNILQPINPSLL